MDTATKDTLKVRLPERLIVEGTQSKDNSTIELRSEKIVELKLGKGDYCILKGKKKHTTIAVVLACAETDTIEPDKIRMNKVIRDNLRVGLGDFIRIEPAENIPNAKKISILPMADTIEGLQVNLTQTCLIPYFRDNYRPVHKGDRFTVYLTNSRPVEFKIVDVNPSMFAVVSAKTEILIEGEPIKREDEAKLDGVGYDDIGGVGKQLALIREMVELPLRHPQLFKTLGIRPSKGVLIYGPPGCGKTLIARAMANETPVSFYFLNGPEIMSKMAGDSEASLRKAFEEAERNLPAIIFIDEIDTVASNKEYSVLERRVAAQLITLMDGLKGREQVIVMAATNKPNCIDPALTMSGRFDAEIDLGAPDEAGRLEILKIHTKSMKLDPKVQLSEIAKKTPGFVGADIIKLCNKAAFKCIREKMDFIDIESNKIDADLLKAMAITQEHFIYAIGICNPRPLREPQFEIPNTAWQDVGGFEDLKRLLQQLILYPIEHPEKYDRFGMDASRSAILYGPPGCGKTLMAKAVAHECSSNFISVKGSELLTMWFGKTEASVRRIFSKARLAAPCVLFFDELECIGIARGMSAGDTENAGDRILNALLIEMADSNANKNIFIIGATNRPELLDEALMKPGKFDQLIYFPMPDKESRVQIFKTVLRKSPVADNVDIEFLAHLTDGFTGKDIAELCKTACQSAIRESIEIEQKNGKKENKPNAPLIDQVGAVPFIERRHFEEAFVCAKKTVTNMVILL